MPIILTSIVAQCQKLSNVEGPLGIYIWAHAYGNTSAIGKKRPLATPLGGPKDVARVLGISPATVRRAWKDLSKRFDITDGYWRPRLDAWDIKTGDGFVKIGGDALHDLISLAGKKRGMSAFRVCCALLPRLSRLAHQNQTHDLISNRWLCSNVAGNRKGSKMSRSSVAGAFSLLNEIGLLNTSGFPRRVSLWSFLIKDRAKLSTMGGKLCGKPKRMIKVEPRRTIKVEPSPSIYIGNVEDLDPGKAGDKIACRFQSIRWVDLISESDHVWMLPEHLNPTDPVLPGLSKAAARRLSTKCAGEDDVNKWLMQEHAGIATATNPIGFMLSCMNKWGSLPGTRSELADYFERKADKIGIRLRHVTPQREWTQLANPTDFPASEAWMKACDDLKPLFDPYDWINWIEPMRGVDTAEGMTIACPDEAHARWVDERYGEIIATVVGQNSKYKAAQDIKECHGY